MTRHATATCLPLLAASIAGGCASSRAPAPIVDVFGSYFPGWLVSMALGVAIVFVVRAVLIALRLLPQMKPLPLVYLGLWALATIGVRVLLFRL